jgi:hypothetical protein
MRIVNIFVTPDVYLYTSNVIVFINNISPANIIQTGIIDCKLLNNKIYLTSIESTTFESVCNKPKLLQTSIIDLPAEIIEIIFDKLDLRS